MPVTLQANSNSPIESGAAMTTTTLRSRAREYALLMRMDKPIGALLLLWPTLWALWLAAAGTPDLFITVIFVCGVFVMRSAGCVINDYADRDFDPHVERTRQRPLAAGRVSPREALGLFAMLLLVALGLVLLLNRLSLMVAVAGALLAASYPYMKRFTYLPQVHLGLAFSSSIPMAFAATNNELPRLAWLLVIGNVLWAVAYDTLYAMVDREDDLRVGVKSTAILFGELDRLFVAIFQFMVIVVMLLVGEQAKLGGYYHLGVLVAIALFCWQHYLIRQRDRQACFKAFLNNNWVGAALFAGLVLDYQMQG